MKVACGRQSVKGRHVLLTKSTFLGGFAASSVSPQRAGDRSGTEATLLGAYAGVTNSSWLKSRVLG